MRHKARDSHPIQQYLALCVYQLIDAGKEYAGVDVYVNMCDRWDTVYSVYTSVWLIFFLYIFFGGLEMSGFEPRELPEQAGTLST
jgi:hypothetical protein